MPAASTQATRTVLDEVATVVDGGADAGTLGEQLYAFVAVLDGQPTLRRVLTDPTVEPDRRADLVDSLLGSYDASARQVVGVAVRQRWSAGRDLTDALERAGSETLLAGAESSGDLAEVEDELFRFARVIEGDGELRDALSDRTAPVEARQRLVAELLDGKASAPTVALARQAVSGRQRSVVGALAEVQRLAAARQQRWVAVVRVARPLGARMQTRLAKALAATFDHELQLNVFVDPEVQGGVKVTVGDEVIDGTVATRLAEARRRLTT